MHLISAKFSYKGLPFSSGFGNSTVGKSGSGRAYRENEDVELATCSGTGFMNASSLNADDPIIFKPTP
jgi:hypothetical protein